MNTNIIFHIIFAGAALSMFLVLFCNATDSPAIGTDLVGYARVLKTQGGDSRFILTANAPVGKSRGGIPGGGISSGGGNANSGGGSTTQQQPPEQGQGKSSGWEPPCPGGGCGGYQNCPHPPC